MLPGVLRCHRVIKMDEQREPDLKSERKIKARPTSFPHSFNPDAKETAAEKMGRIIERELSYQMSE